MQFLIILFVLSLQTFATIDYQVLTETWCINKTCYNLEIANTKDQKSKGLMYRKFLSPYRGMKFNWETEEIRLMWMKNTFSSLDILWINKNNIIIDIKENLPTNNTSIIKSSKKTQFIVELPAGSVKKNNFSQGDILTKATF